MSDNTALPRAIADARALLDAMAGSDLAQLHVASGGVEIFIARHPGPGGLSSRTQAADVAEAVRATTEHRVSAPHVATVVAIAAAGEQVVPNGIVATIRVLDRHHELKSAVAGRIVRVAASVGDLVEYGQDMLVIEAAA